MTVVTVGFPAINCKFDTDCKITVNDTSANFTLPGTSGSAFLQSRTWPPGQAGTIGAGKTAYLYRLDLRNLVGLTASPCVNRLKVTFGPVTALDYNGDGQPDQVFVATSGGLGTVGPSSVDKTGNAITFNFATPVCSGSSPGHGNSSYFFGLASTQLPVAIQTTISYSPTAGTLSLAARAAKVP
ncbi:MAG: hypothetical protein ABJC13_06585 [Acidobacteriota bacterium]